MIGKSKEATIDMIRKAIDAFSKYQNYDEPIILPPHLYDLAEKQGFNMKGYVRRGKVKRSYTKRRRK